MGRKKYIFFNLFYFDNFKNFAYKTADWCKKSQIIIHENILFVNLIEGHECEKKLGWIE